MLTARPDGTGGLPRMTCPGAAEEPRVDRSQAAHATQADRMPFLPLPCNHPFAVRS
jgi:hypothetical protein